MPQKDQQPESMLVKPKDAFTLILCVSNIHATCLHPFLRKGQGVDVPGIFGILALLMMGLYAESMQSYGMVRFICVWLVALVIMRLRRERYEHSQYQGYPWWIMKLPPVKWSKHREKTAKALEPWACLLAGMFISQWSETVGRFVAMGFVSMLAIEIIHRMLERRTEIELVNATIEGEWIARRR